MDKTKHHKSCRESDQDLVYKCAQCGVCEDASHIEGAVEKLQNTLRVVQANREADAENYGHYTAENKRLKEQLAAIKAAAVWIGSLDGFMISAADLTKLTTTERTTPNANN